MKTYGMSFAIALPAAALGAALGALVFGYFCVRLTRIYFAMLTLAFSQIVWAICFKWNDVTGGDQGLPDVPYPNLDWMSSIPFLDNLRVSDQFYVLTLALVMVSLAVIQRIIASPFGRMLTTIRENPQRAASIGLDVRRYELAAFVVAGGFAGIAGALFGIFNRGVFADYVYWPKSAEVMIMAILGGIGHFWGPVVGAATLVLLNQEITSYTQYWPFVLGAILLRRDRRGVVRRLCLASPKAGRLCQCLRCAASPSRSAVSEPCPASTWSWPRARLPRSSGRTVPANRRCSI